MVSNFLIDILIMSFFAFDQLFLTFNKSYIKTIEARMAGFFSSFLVDLFSKELEIIFHFYNKKH